VKKFQIMEVNKNKMREREEMHVIYPEGYPEGYTTEVPLPKPGYEMRLIYGTAPKVPRFSLADVMGTLNFLILLLIAAKLMDFI